MAGYGALVGVILVLMLCPGLLMPVDGERPRFFPDDPLQREPETQDASKVQEWDVGLTPDLLLNLFGQPGDPRTNQRAHNVNTADEVPDSSWFTNRIYARSLSLDEIARGPTTIDGPAPGRWTVIRSKSAGVSPGFTVRDEKGEVWFLTFDAKENPVAGTAAIAIASRLFWAMGYNQVESYLATIRPEDLVLSESVTIRAHGKRRRFTQADLDDVLARSATRPDGSYRVLAGRAIPGRTVGPFRYHDTRPDDPNDIVPHEHRRELRALQVFGAWTNLVDMKAGNTLDTVIPENGRGVVRHYLQDVGSTFGTGALAPRDGDEGYEHLYDARPVWRRFITFGLFVSPWQTMRYREHPEVGRFEGQVFDPVKWRPRVPMAALRHARADDLFWAALRVMAFSDEQIRTAVGAGDFTDRAAEKLLADVLIERRDRIGAVYFSNINPLVRLALTDGGVLTFENPAVRAAFARAPEQGYEATWHRFDNATGQTEALGPATTSVGEQMQSPGPLPGGAQAFVKISIRALQPAHAAWAVPVDVYFRRTGATWTVVGIDR
ncbi:MAG TPA: hypothetical protein VMO26_21185 [Vicinamibacterales bacterium]|nr:hypothetical protein [Vicinamibacterales bacterium]